MSLQPQQIPDNDIIRQTKVVVNHNADLLVVSGEATDTGFKLDTPSGASVEVDLSAKFVTRAEHESESTAQPASPSQPGPIAVASQTEAEAATDDTKAMTPLKVAQQLAKLGIPAFDLEGVTAGQTLVVNVDSTGKITISAAAVDIYGLGRGFYGDDYSDFNGNSFSPTDFFAS